jgi:hypothetical protein
VRVSFRTGATALALVAFLAAIGVGSAQAVVRHVAYGKPGKAETPKIQGFHPDSKQPPTVIFPKRGIWRSPAKAGQGKVQTVCTQMQIWIPVGTPTTSWRLKTPSKNYCGPVKPSERAQMGQWNWTGDVATPYHAEFVITWSATVTKKAKNKKPKRQVVKLGKATYDYNSAADYTCITLFCLVDTDSGTNFPYLSFN